MLKSVLIRSNNANDMLIFIWPVSLPIAWPRLPILTSPSTYYPYFFTINDASRVPQSPSFVYFRTSSKHQVALWAKIDTPSPPSLQLQKDNEHYSYILPLSYQQPLKICQDGWSVPAPKKTPSPLGYQSIVSLLCCRPRTPRARRSHILASLSERIRNR